jgi:Kef-type K+ transport system membrane component KefB
LFIIKSIVVFGVIVLSRYVAIKATQGGAGYTKKEEYYMALNMPKGIAVAVLVFSLSVRELVPLEVINNLIIMVMIYSLVLSTIANKFAKKFLRFEVEEDD